MLVGALGFGARGGLVAGALIVTVFALTDLLDGTITLPFILARERDPGLREIDLRSLEPDAAEAVCDRIAATGSPEEVRAEARERVASAKRALRESGIGGEELQMLELVADGVVERYS